MSEARKEIWKTTSPIQPDFNACVLLSDSNPEGNGEPTVTERDEFGEHVILSI